MKKVCVFVVAYIAGVCSAQVSVSGPGYRIDVERGGLTRTQTAMSNGEAGKVLAEDAEIEGVTIVDSDVFIDGERVEKNKSWVISRKTGRKYQILRDRDGNISVTER